MDRELGPISFKEMHSVFATCMLYHRSKTAT
jgi:hypothetical protein